jgi:hypothetical protein
VRATQAQIGGRLQLDEANTGQKSRPVLGGDYCPGYLNGQIFTCRAQPQQPDLHWQLQGSAKEVPGRIYRLTSADSSEAEAGAIAARRESSTSWVLRGQYRIFGSTTAYFGDGLAIALTPDSVGGFGQELGLSSLVGGFAVVIDTYNNLSVPNSNENRPLLQIWGEGRKELNPLATTTLQENLRAAAWQGFEVRFDNGTLTASVGTIAVSYQFPLEEIDRALLLRISASTGVANDTHEVRALRYSGRRIRGI